MRFIAILILNILLVPWTSSLAHAYTLMIDVREDRIEIERPVELASGGFAQQDVDINIRAEGLDGAPWRLQILAIDDMQGPNPIPITAFSWDAFNAPFLDGQLVKGVPQILAQGSGDIDTTGRVRFKFLAGNYQAGSYTSIVRFILSSP